MKIGTTTFEKAIERDSTFVTQQFFAQNLTQDLAQQYGIDCPHRPIVIHHANEQNIQLFENKQALHWIQDQLLAKNQRDSHFMQDLIDLHKDTLKKLETIWGRKELSSAMIDEYKNLIRRATLNVTIYFYSGVDSRTSAEISELISNIRKTDELGVQNDEFVRRCVARHGLDAELARVLTINELLAPQEDVLRRRIKGAILVDGQLQEGDFQTFTRAHPEYKLISADAEDTDLVRGQVAMKGVARGKVKIVKNRQQAAEITEGDVLVSPMTQPDFMRAMTKAVAFVTDEGGIVCHAAIIAREMYKPCIIGTKVATQVFKDGDMVEVDAEKGIVRKL